MKVIRIINHILNSIFIIFFVVSLAFVGYAIYDIYAVYEESELSGDILKYKPSLQGENEFGEKFSIDDLKKINTDIVGWVRVNDTNIDYPILAGVSNSDYLDRNYQRDYSPGGSIFLDYRNDRDFSNDYSVIYGHNMSYGKMFSDIKKYKDKAFFKTHSKGALYTEDSVYNLEIISLNIIDANHDIGYKISTFKNEKNHELFDNFYNKALQKNNTVYKEDDKYLLLSTCYGVGTYDRSVLFSRIVKSDESQVITEMSKSNDSYNEQLVLKKIQKKKSFDNIFVYFVLVLVILVIYVRISVLIKEKTNKNK